MKTSLDCIPCMVNSFMNLLKTSPMPEAEKPEAMRKLLAFLAKTDYQASPPVLGRELHRLIRRELHNPDPYREIKIHYNRMMLEMVPQFEKMIAEAEDPFDTAMRLAIAGNVIDFGPQHRMDVQETISRVLHAELAIDDSPALRQEISRAKSLLYVGDNCGEIVLDKLFLEQINLPEMYFAVRGAPVINDVTVEDARITGIDDIAVIVSTGEDTPGAVWGTVSDEFRRLLSGVDLVISKGQGNLEGLSDAPRDIYFMLTVKCELVANLVGTTVGDFIVARRNPLSV